jgi:phytanoyl-CoA dioxygenase PhyH
MNGTQVTDALETTATFRLSPQQVAFFNTFGFIKLPGLFKPEIARITEGFEEVFAANEPDKVITEDPLQDTDNTFENRRRLIMFRIIERSEKLRWLASDPRVVNIATSIVGDGYEAKPTDGHVFHCDTSWHPDRTTADGFRVKLSFYLDPQRANSGAIRVIPGSQDHESAFGRALLSNLYGSPKKVLERYGTEADAIPCWTVETDPGDLICWDVRTFHATFHGFERRRLFSMTFCAAR